MRVRLPAEKGEWGVKGVEHYPEKDDWSYLFSEWDPARVSAIRHNGQPMISRDRIFGEQERLLTAVLIKVSPPTEIEKKMLRLSRVWEAEYQKEINPQCVWCGRRKREVTHREEVTFTRYGDECTEKVSRRSRCSVSGERHRWASGPIV